MIINVRGLVYMYTQLVVTNAWKVAKPGWNAEADGRMSTLHKHHAPSSPMQSGTRTQLAGRVAAQTEGAWQTEAANRVRAASAAR